MIDFALKESFVWFPLVQRASKLIDKITDPVLCHIRLLDSKDCFVDWIFIESIILLK